jgi:hypothetical protein
MQAFEACMTGTMSRWIVGEVRVDQQLSHVCSGGMEAADVNVIA